MSTESISVLLIEDNPGDARLLREMLSELKGAPCKITWVERLSAGLDSLRASGADVVLLDLSLPDSHGLDTFVRVQKQTPHVPILVLSGLDDEDLAVTAVREGAQDYLVKGQIDGNLLIRAIRYAIERKRTEEALRESLQFSSSLLGDSPHPVIVINPDTSIRYANPALERLTGFPSAELTGKVPPYPWWPKEDYEKNRAELERALQQGVEKLEKQFVKRDGTRFWVETTSTPIVSDGEPEYQLENWVNITERKRAEEEIHRRAAHLEALNAIIAAAAAAPDLPNLLQTALAHTLQALGLEMGAIWRSGQYVTHGLQQEQSQVKPHEIIASALAIADTIVVEDWQAIQDDHPLAVIGPRLIHFGIRASLAAPILAEGRRIGGLAILSPEPRAWPPDEIVLAEAIGRQLGATAERLRLFQAEREQRELAEALQEAAAVVSSTLEADEVLDRILEQVERVVPGDAFNIMLLTEDGQARVARWRGYGYNHATDTVEKQLYSIDDMPNLRKMVRTGEPVIFQDTFSDPSWVMLEGREWLRSYIGAPITIGGVTVGFLNVNGTRTSQFTADDARRLQAFASHAATAIQNAQLYRELRNYATQLEERVQERTARIQAQYAQLEAILHSSSDGIIVTNGRGEITQINPVANTWLSQMLSPEDARRLQEAVKELAMHADERPEMVLELTGLDLELSAAPITQSGGDEASAVVAVHDVSHLKALDRMKSRFVSNVSHELRTPITTIKLYAALMQRSPPDKIGEYLKALSQEADRQARLVEDILQISRIDAGRLEIRPVSALLNELAEATYLTHQVLAQSRGLSLVFQPAEPGPIALVDPDRTTQVLSNLVMNAVQYTPEGGKVTISTSQEETDGRMWATATVADTGVGIPEDELAHIFERFFRGEQPKLMQISGTGLGLAIVKEIVELQGGRVSVESKVGAGTVFTIRLPLANEAGKRRLSESS